MSSKSDVRGSHVLRQLARNQLRDSFQSIAGPKDLVIDKELIKPLDRIAGASYLKEQGVNKIYLLDDNFSSNVSSKVVFIVRANVNSVRKAAAQINSSTDNDGKTIKYKLLMVPRKLHVCERVLEQEGVIGFVEVSDLDLGLLPLNEDVLSLDIPDFYRTFFLERDCTWIYTVATSLFDIQMLFGTIHKLYCFGKASQMTYDLYNLLQKEKPVKRFNKEAEVDYLFIFDRDVDYTSILLTPGTYEGLLDEMFEIKYGFVDLGKEVTGSEQNVKLSLDNNDKVYGEIRNRHFSNVFAYLSDTAKQLKSDNSERKNMTVAQMRSFVSEELKTVQQEKQLLAWHIGICEAIVQKKSKDFNEQLHIENCIVEGSEFQESVTHIEELLMNRVSIPQILRLLCLLSSTNDGLEMKLHNSLKTQFMQSYGHEHIVTFHLLKQTGLFVDYDSRNKVGKMVSSIAYLPRFSSFRTTLKKFNLIPKRETSSNLNDLSNIGYVFSGAYIPLTSSIVKQVLENNGVYVVEEARKLFQGYCLYTDLSPSARRIFEHLDSSASSSVRRNVIIYFLGGITYAEIAAFRRLSELAKCNITIVTTSIINGNSFIDIFTNDASKLKETRPA